MKKFFAFTKILLATFTVLTLSLGTLLPLGVEARAPLAPGTVFKGKNHSTLYYLDEDGGRLVFPNSATYFSWYDNFDNVVEVDDEELALHRLKGNVRYKAGVLLVKVVSNPKVFAVGPNGNLRWITSERLAKALYGDNWNLLVDDVPVTFFTNYVVGDPIENEEEFDPEDEEDEVATINENRRAKIKKKIRKKIAKKLDSICRHLEKRLNRLQRRLAKRGIELDDLGAGFLERCVADDKGDGDNDDDDDGKDDKDEKDDKKRSRKITICHIPPGDPENPQTIKIGKKAARAHLAHGDTIGACEDDGDDDDLTDITPPVISGKTATPTTTSAIIAWTTDEAATSSVEYAKESLTTATSTQEVDDETLVTSHSIDLVDLEAETTYFYMVTSVDAAGNKATSTEMSFTMLSLPVVEVDETPPVISDILATPTSTSAVITWTTDEASTSRVEFATSSLDTASSTEEVTDATLTTSHSLELTGLATSTEYFYVVESEDADSNKATSAEDTFTTSS